MQSRTGYKVMGLVDDFFKIYLTVKKKHMQKSCVFACQFACVTSCMFSGQATYSLSNFY